jgi:hypothetical protein
MRRRETAKNSTGSVAGRLTTNKLLSRQFSHVSYFLYIAANKDLEPANVLAGLMVFHVEQVGVLTLPAKFRRFGGAMFHVEQVGALTLAVRP